MLDAASDVRVVVSLNSRPLLPPTDLDAEDSLLPKFLDVEDKDADVVADAAGAPNLNTPQDVDPPSRQS